MSLEYRPAIYMKSCGLLCISVLTAISLLLLLAFSLRVLSYSSSDVQLLFAAIWISASLVLILSGIAHIRKMPTPSRPRQLVVGTIEVFVGACSILVYVFIHNEFRLRRLGL